MLGKGHHARWFRTVLFHIVGKLDLEVALLDTDTGMLRGIIMRSALICSYLIRGIDYAKRDAVFGTCIQPRRSRKQTANFRTELNRISNATMTIEAHGVSLIQLPKKDGLRFPRRPLSSQLWEKPINLKTYNPVFRNTCLLSADQFITR
jgi:hypothetical protein